MADVSEQSAGANILVVEDNPANMMLVTHVLKRAGYTVFQAKSSVEAREQIESNELDLILMDVQLPGEDGLSLTRALKADPRTGDIPVVALTAHAMRGDELLAKEAGCEGYVSKPIDTRTFADFVKQYVRQRV